MIQSAHIPQHPGLYHSNPFTFPNQEKPSPHQRNKEPTRPHHHPLQISPSQSHCRHCHCCCHEKGDSAANRHKSRTLNSNHHSPTRTNPAHQHHINELGDPPSPQNPSSNDDGLTNSNHPQQLHLNARNSSLPGNSCGNNGDSYPFFDAICNSNSLNHTTTHRGSHPLSAPVLPLADAGSRSDYVHCDSALLGVHLSLGVAFVARQARLSWQPGLIVF
jgi:hypothetical protein